MLALLLSFGFSPPLQAGEVKSATQPPATLRILTTARAVHDLSSAEAARHYPVHLRVECMVCFPSWYGFFAFDGMSAVYVQTKNHVPLTTAIQPGTLLEIVGITSPGEFAPIVDQGSLQVLGKAPLPPARPVSLDRLSTGVEDGQWIAFEGTVRSAAFREAMLDLVIASGRLQVEVMTPPGGKDPGWLLNARVRVSGAAGPIFNQRTQLIGVNVYSPSVDSIQVLQPAPGDPFSLPLKPVKDVFGFAPGTGSDHLVRIRGVVTARWGQTVSISDGIQGASVLGRDTTALKPGDLVDAVGYPALGNSSQTIEDAVFRVLGTAPLPEPKPVTVKEALSGDFEGDLVRLNGRLIEQQKAADQTRLLVYAGGSVFSAIIPGELKDQSLAGVSNGSKIQLTGICVISETQASRHFRLPKAFQILLRSPADVVVLERAPWWTTTRLLLVLAVALVATVVVLAWVVLLRRRVAQQTRLLRQQAEMLRESERQFRHMALHDALTGLATRLLLQDRLGVALESARRHGSGLAVLMVDLDKFKEINDTYGHQAGDEVLRVSAERLLAAVRKGDTVARLGGDEFVVLLPDLTDPPAAQRIAASIVESLAVPVPFCSDKVPVSVSVGLCSASAGVLDAEVLLRDADTALYEAKARGRNCYHIFTPDKKHTRTL